MPVRRAFGNGGASGQPVHVHLHVAGREITQVIMPDFVKAIRNGTGLKI